MPWALTALMLAHHLGLWLWLSQSRRLPLLGILDRWDAQHYSTLVLQGYSWPRWVFLPLYPGVVWLVRQGLRSALVPQVVGCGVSTLCLLAFVAWNTRWGRQGKLDGAMTPRTSWGWFLLLYGPASFALHSHHTEGLFLLLSFGALAFAWRGQLVPAALLAALCVWTRNQGTFVAIAAALLLAGQQTSWRGRLTRFGVVGAVALLSFAGLLVFQWRQAGHPLAFIQAQREWNHADSVWSAIRGLWFGNPWHTTFSPWLLLRHLFGALWLATAIALWRQSRPLSLYALLGLLVMLPQGDLANAFRYGAVLFPAFFLAGDALATRPAWLRWTVALGAVWLNHEVAYAYATGGWAY